MDYAEADAFINQVFLRLTSVRWNAIESSEEHYIIKSIYYQCWNLLFQQKHAAMHQARDLDVSGDDGRDYRMTSDHPDPQSILEGRDLFEQVVLFKASLKPADVRILNGLIDDRKLTELSKEIGISYNALSVRIKRLRERLAKHLAACGFEAKTIQRHLGAEKIL